MDAHIRWSQNVTEEDAYLLEKLADLIKRDGDVSVNLDKQEVKPGEKDSGLTIDIAIAGLALSGISTLISVLSYKGKNCSASFTLDGVTYQINNIKVEEIYQIQESFKQAELKGLPQTLDIEISRRDDDEGLIS